MIPASATECTCHKCGAQFYIGRTNPKRLDDYLMPAYCPLWGSNASLSGTTLTVTFNQGDASRAVDFDGACDVCGRTLKEHSIEGIKACARKQRGT